MVATPAPVANIQRQPTPADAFPDMRAEDDLEPVMMTTITQSRPPALQGVIGGVASVGALSQILLGIALAAPLMIILSALGLVAGVGLLGDRRWGWLTGLGAFGLDALYLAWFGAAASPIYIPGIAFFLGAALSGGLAFALTRPEIKARHTGNSGRRRRRF